MIPLKEGVIISIRKVVKHEEGAIFILSLFVEFDHARSMIYHSAAYIRNDRIPTSLDVCCPRLNPTSGMCILDVYGSCQISGNRMVEWGVGGGGVTTGAVVLLLLILLLLLLLLLPPPEVV